MPAEAPISVSMSWFVNLVASVLLSALSMQAPASSKHFTSSKECGFEFDYPGDWVVEAINDKTPCRVRLRPSDFADRMKEWDVDVYTLEVGKEHGDFLAVAADNFFDFVKGRWVMLGRLDLKTDADVVSTEQWHGLRGVAAVGCYHVGGGYAGLCEEPALVLRDDDDNMWSMRGGPQSQVAFDVILSTFRFREP